MNGTILVWQDKTKRIKTQEFISYLEEQPHTLKYILGLDKKLLPLMNMGVTIFDLTNNRYILYLICY